MKKISLSDIFSTNFRSERTKKDRYVSLGIKNHTLLSTNINLNLRSSRLEKRSIDDMPFKVLDAPGILDDFYLNILEWSKNDLVCIGLSESFYQYNYHTKKVKEILTNNEGNFVTGITCSKSPIVSEDIVAVGCNNGKVKLLNNGKEFMRLNASESRVCAMSWNDHILSCGTKQGVVINYDLRTGAEVKRYSNHVGEICGLKWSPDKRFLASGGNDNQVRIYELRTSIPRHIITAHNSAVKALDWCPWKVAELITGGGTKDKTIKIWDTNECKLLKSVDVKSQVCTLNYIEKYKEVVSSHGFSNNEIIMWKATNLKKMSVFGKHENRVLNVAISPDGSKMASVSADENLKFWKLFDSEKAIPRNESIFR
ncbi:hypothetical protein EDEG_01194 [Edhazardia aedis USNM 41457]|uniref:CDC20/Fizzy WD40 domain-containing protein n=1 Tax=Edhazardia aedis (strain USNM 41457) TaxID=1003232 RepID=J9DPY6_EDHAE|nr:hypothetical protein EDEG_01194 [Edhazardia aedis USNM 41457]|eukprot:EJW04610.1 hypothetical protein EDEG_01194 [Edhazardia aedis USNM 41457]